MRSSTAPRITRAPPRGGARPTDSLPLDAGGRPRFVGARVPLPQPRPGLRHWFDELVREPAALAAASAALIGIGIVSALVWMFLLGHPNESPSVQVQGVRTPDVTVDVMLSGQDGDMDMSIDVDTGAGEAAEVRMKMRETDPDAVHTRTVNAHPVGAPAPRSRKSKRATQRTFDVRTSRDGNLREVKIKVRGPKTIVGIGGDP